MNFLVLFYSVVFFSLSTIAFSKGAEKYVVDTALSQLNWEGKKIASGHDGTVSFSSGEAEIVNDKLVNATFVIDMKSIKNLDIKDPSSNAKLVGHLKSDDFFSVDKYPTATLKIISAKLVKGTQYQMKGNLTIRDQTHPVSFDADVKKNNNQYLATTAFSIDRTKWGVRYNSKNFFVNLAADKIINNDMNFKANIVLNSSSPTTISKSEEKKSPETKEKKADKKNY